MTIAEIVKNKSKLIADKLASVVTHKTCSLAIRSDEASKAESNDSVGYGSVIYPVINTTNWLDSHADVHAKGIWGDDLGNPSYILDHDFSVSGLIAQPSDVKAEVRRMRWKQLGLDINGTTDALVFEVTLKEYANPDFMRAIQNGVTLQNSVRMRYDEVVLCVNDKDYGAEYEAWNKYIKEVANREDAEKLGYFWYIKKARVYLEGSAVLRGSNEVTPVLSKQNNEPSGVNNKQEEGVKTTPVWLNLM